MTDSTEVEKAPQAQLPALRNTPANEIGSDDVALPRVYLGQYMSDHVQENRVPAGCIFTASGSDDPDPQVLWEQGDEGGVIAHVLALKKGKSITVDGELELYDFNDPDAPADAWVTYNYAVALPEIDEQVPYKWLLSRTGKPAAQQINFAIVKNEAKGPVYQLAFEFTAAPRKNNKGSFFVPRVRLVEATEKNVEIAQTLAILIGDQPVESNAPSEEPAI